MQAGLNFYSSFYNNPVKFADPFGLDVWAGQVDTVGVKIFCIGFSYGSMTLKNLNTGQICYYEVLTYHAGIGLDGGFSRTYIFVTNGPKDGKGFEGDSVPLELSYKYGNAGVSFGDSFSFGAGLSVGGAGWFGTGWTQTKLISCCPEILLNY